TRAQLGSLAGEANQGEPAHFGWIADTLVGSATLTLAPRAPRGGVPTVGRDTAVSLRGAAHHLDVDAVAADHHQVALPDLRAVGRPAAVALRALLRVVLDLSHARERGVDPLPLRRLQCVVAPAATPRLVTQPSLTACGRVLSSADPVLAAVAVRVRRLLGVADARLHV